MERKLSTSANRGAIFSATEGLGEVQPQVEISGPSDDFPGRLPLAQMENKGALAPDVRAREMQGSSLYERIATTKVIDANSYALVCDLGKEAKRIGKLIEEEFQPSIQQADKAHKGMIKLRDRALANFEEAELLSKDKIAESVVKTDVEGVSLAERWYPKIENENLIPREYLVPDMTKIKAMVLALKGEARIPGVVACMKPSVTFRT